MLSDLFSTFDPRISTVYNFMPAGFWGITYLITALIFPMRFVRRSRRKILTGSILSLAKSIVKRNKNNPIQGVGWLLTSLFLILVMINLAGLVPWVIRISSHLVFTVTLALPLWLARVLATTSNPVKKLASLVGNGLPIGLAPVIGIIEVIRFIIRPLTLALRLAANIMAGHIIIGLLIAALIATVSVKSLLLGALVIGIYLFETAICLVQAYVFTLLLRIYIGEWVPASPLRKR